MHGCLLPKKIKKVWQNTHIGHDTPQECVHTSFCLDGLNYNRGHWGIFLMFVRIEELLYRFQAPCFFSLILSQMVLLGDEEQGHV